MTFFMYFCFTEYVKALQKPITASYSKGLFPQYACDDGTKYNVNEISQMKNRILIPFNTGLPTSRCKNLGTFYVYV